MKDSRDLIPVLLVLFTAVPVRAQSSEPIQVSEVKPLLKLAIDQGFAHGVIVGEAASFMRQRFETTASIEVDVRALHALPEPGCSRLQVTTRQKDVFENGKRSNKELTYQVSYCRDGRFPERK